MSIPLICSTAGANVPFPCHNFDIIYLIGLAESWHLIVSIIYHLQSMPSPKWNIWQMCKQIFYCKFVTPQCLPLRNSSADTVSYYYFLLWKSLEKMILDGEKFIMSITFDTKVFFTYEETFSWLFLHISTISTLLILVDIHIVEWFLVYSIILWV